MTSPSPAATAPAVLPTYYISHGGGPWPYMPAMRSRMQKLEVALAAIGRDITPEAVLMVSAHWEEAEVAIMSAPQPAMLYDYYGFPAETYQVLYPAPGAPALAQHILGLLQQAGIAARLDPERGFDHGAFAPLAVMYPKATTPVLQLSLKEGLDPAAHIALGQALAPLRAAGVLIVGSGASFHNLQLRGASVGTAAKEFDDWLHDSLENHSQAERKARLLRWQSAPGARVAHPREEHLLPLMVALGAAIGERAETVYHEDGDALGWTVSSWRFGEIPKA